MRIGERATNPFITDDQQSADRNQLSFNEQATSLSSNSTPAGTIRPQQTIRRRVFAQLAPPGSSLPATPQGEQGEEGNAEQNVRQTLLQFGQNRRERFLASQRPLRHTDGQQHQHQNHHHQRPHVPRWIYFRETEIDDDGDEASNQQPQFPSNDVDSYWYNQPTSTTGAPLPTLPLSTREEQESLLRSHPHQHRHRANDDESRRAMLGVLRPTLQHSLVASSSSPFTSSDEEDGSQLPASPFRTDEQRERFERQQQRLQRLQFPIQQNLQQPSWLSAILARQQRLQRSREQRRLAVVNHRNNPLLSSGSNEKPDTLDGSGNGAGNGDSSAIGGRNGRQPGLYIDDDVPLSNGGRQCSRDEERARQWVKQHTVRSRPLRCSLLRPGMKFIGVQKISQSSLAPSPSENMTEWWDVHVVIQTVDMSRGQVTGMMTAINVPRMPTTVETFWEGEIIDFVNYLPLTAKWQATGSDDAQHWSLFDSVKNDPQAFLRQWPRSLCGRRMPRVLEDCIFMRWKEREFVNVHPSETGLTIEGFYYVCMCRTTGRIEGKLAYSYYITPNRYIVKLIDAILMLLIGVYFDPMTPPYQCLCLNVENRGKKLGFSSFETA